VFKICLVSLKGYDRYISILDIYIDVIYMCGGDINKHGGIGLEAMPLPGLLHLIILCIVKEGSTYGGEIHRKIKERFKIDVPKALVYTLLRRMEKRGLVVSTWDVRESGPARRMYTITEEGVNYLFLASERLKRAIPIIEDIVSASEKGAGK